MPEHSGQEATGRPGMGCGFPGSPQGQPLLGHMPASQTPPSRVQGSKYRSLLAALPETALR